MPRYYSVYDDQFLNKDETQKFFDQITCLRDRAIFQCMFTFGLRASEVVKLKWSDVDFEQKQILVKATKKGKVAQEYMSDSLASTIRNYRQVRTDSNIILFLSNKKGRLSTVQIFRLFQKYATLANLPINKRHSHCARHSLAIKCSRNGYTAEQTQSLLRHNSIQSTMKYYKIMPDQRRALQVQLEGLF